MVNMDRCRGDSNSLTSDILKSFWPHYFMYFISLMQCIGYPTKLIDNMAIGGFWPIISRDLLFPRDRLELLVPKKQGIRFRLFHKSLL